MRWALFLAVCFTNAAACWADNGHFQNMKGYAKCNFVPYRYDYQRGKLPFQAGEAVLGVLIDMKTLGAEVFGDPRLIDELTRHANEKLERHCAGEGVHNNKRAIYVTDRGYFARGLDGSSAATAGFVTASTDGGGTWFTEKNTLTAKVEKDHQKKVARANSEAARMAEQRAARAKQEKIRADFVRSFGVQEFVASDDVFANPFRFKDKVVAIYFRGSRMLEEDVGLFGDKLIVAGVPAAEFSGKQAAVLAVTVRGTREYNGAMVPDLEYVGSYVCAMHACGDFYPN